jgi:uncharacterized protein (TIGR02285 family)
MARRQWITMLFALLIYSPVCMAVIQLPLQLQFHHYDPLTVTLMNKGQYYSVTTETNLLLFQHFSKPVRLIEVPMARSELMMDNLESICTLDKVKNSERLGKYLFSKPVNFFLGYRLYQQQNSPAVVAQQLNAKGQLQSVVALMQANPHAKLLVPAHFSFGELLDQQIQQLPSKQVVAIGAPHYHTNFIGMFASGRADFVIAYPTEMSASMQSDTRLQVRSYGIAGVPELISGHLMCTDTAANRQFIQAVDKVLTSLYQDPRFILAHTRYLKAEDAKHISRLIRQYAR